MKGEELINSAGNPKYVAYVVDKDGNTKLWGGCPDNMKQQIETNKEEFLVHLNKKYNSNYVDIWVGDNPLYSSKKNKKSKYNGCNVTGREDGMAPQATTSSRKIKSDAQEVKAMGAAEVAYKEGNTAGALAALKEIGYSDDECEAYFTNWDGEKESEKVESSKKITNAKGEYQDAKQLIKKYVKDNQLSDEYGDFVYYGTGTGNMVGSFAVYDEIGDYLEDIKNMLEEIGYTKIGEDYTDSGFVAYFDKESIESSRKITNARTAGRTDLQKCIDALSDAYYLIQQNIWVLEDKDNILYRGFVKMLNQLDKDIDSVEQVAMDEEFYDKEFSLDDYNM